MNKNRVLDTLVTIIITGGLVASGFVIVKLVNDWLYALMEAF